MILFIQGLSMLSVALAPLIENGAINWSWTPWTPFRIAALPLEILGIVLMFASLKAMRSNFEIRVEPKDQLVTSWPFSLVRNPIYLGGILFGFGYTLSQHSIYGVIATAVLIKVLDYKISLEEVALKEKFGEAYEEYCKKTPRLIPFI